MHTRSSRAGRETVAHVSTISVSFFNRCFDMHALRAVLVLAVVLAAASPSVEEMRMQKAHDIQAKKVRVVFLVTS